jgi:ribosomal protein L37AE/L43A
MVLAICCPESDCGSLEVTRDSSLGGVAYWSCKTCNHRWKESADTGRGHARIIEL